MLKRWFINKYHLPTTHELFTSQSEADLLQEFYEDLWVRRDEVREQIDVCEQSGSGASPKFRDALYDQLNAINRTLGEPEELFDEVASQWERDFEEGRIPDFDLGKRNHG